jgi:hypothetical protein
MAQAQRLTDVEELARELIATRLAVAAGSFAVAIDVILPGDLTERRDRARALRLAAERLREEAAEELREVARSAHDAGLSVRELAVALDLSHQRAQQILAETSTRRFADPAQAPAYGKQRRIA